MVFKKVVLGVVGVSNSCSSSHVLFTVGIVSFILCQKINLNFFKKKIAPCMWCLERAFLLLVLGRGCVIMYIFVPIQYVIDKHL